MTTIYRRRRISAYLLSLFVLFFAAFCAAQTSKGNIPLCDIKKAKTEDFLQIINDKYGPDVKDYVRHPVISTIRSKWLLLIPEEAMPPLLKQGCVAIQFSILKTGSISGVEYLTTSGSVALDRAAYGGITSSSPLPPVPASFTGEQLKIRVNFFYNPGGKLAPPTPLPRIANELQPTMVTADLIHIAPPDSISPARLLHVLAPEYPRKAHKKKIHGSVILDATVDEKGKVTDVSVVSGDPMLADAAVNAVKTWTFEPFMKSGRAVRVQQELTIDFSLHWKTGELAAFPPATVVALPMAK